MTDTIHDHASQAASAEPSARSSGGTHRVLLLAIVLLGATALVYFLPIRSWLHDAGPVRQALAPLGMWVYPAWVLIVAVLVGCGVPRLAFCAICGMILGFWWGLLVVQLGTLLGYYAAFLFIRWGGREWALRRWPALRKWAELAHEHGVMGVILLRQLPIHGSVVNLGLGLSHVKHRHFLLGTLIGSLPESIPATLVGAGLVKASPKATAGYLAVAVVVFAVIWMGCGYMLRAMRASRTGAELIAEAETLKGARD